MNKSIIILYGPTGVGKSDYALFLGDQFPLEIVNADVGQFYTPFSLGTAKPDWKKEKIPHHLFDILSEPKDFSVHEYRKKVLTLCDEIWQKGAIPVLVGGSGFYLKSLFFPPHDNLYEKQTTTSFYKDLTTKDAWNLLESYDQERAHAIHPHDRYRIDRALDLFLQTGTSTCTLKPEYQNIDVSILFICITRKRDILYKRINERTHLMMQSGWLNEVAALQKTPWIPFLKQKKLIGYNDIIDFFENEESLTQEKIIEIIAQKTRHYAKRQMTFWRMLKKELDASFTKNQYTYELMIDNEKQAEDELKKLVINFLNQRSLKKADIHESMD